MNKSIFVALIPLVEGGENGELDAKAGCTSTTYLDKKVERILVLHMYGDKLFARRQTWIIGGEYVATHLWRWEFSGGRRGEGDKDVKLMRDEW